jgi:hypothetical protein
MTDFETAKQFYHHQEYQKSFDLMLELLKNKSIVENAIEYPDLLCYLGDSRLALYETTKNKSLIFEAITDYASAENNLLIKGFNPSKCLERRMKKCSKLIKTCP